MKPNIKQIALLGLCSLGLLFSCDQDMPDKNRKVVIHTPKEKTAFDHWLGANYLDAYNLDFMYRMTDNEVPRSRNLAPATLQSSMRMAKLVKHAWFGVYDEVAGPVFMRQYSPRQIQLVGSRSTDKSGGDLLGTAENGLKVVLYMVNYVEPTELERLNWVYFGTMHHEFAHILHQQKKWPDEFNEVTAGDYLPGTWANGDVARMSVYAPKGFVTAYSRKVNSEDVAEVTAAIICWSQAQWDELFAAAGEEGTKKIKRKVEIMKRYMKESYGIDIERLRDVAARRLGEAPQLKFIEDSWAPLLENKLRSVSFVNGKPKSKSEWRLPNLPTGEGEYSCGVYLQHQGCPFQHLH